MIPCAAQVLQQSVLYAADGYNMTNKSSAMPGSVGSKVRRLRIYQLKLGGFHLCCSSNSRGGWGTQKSLLFRPTQESLSLPLSPTLFAPAAGEGRSPPSPRLSSPAHLRNSVSILIRAAWPLRSQGQRPCYLYSLDPQISCKPSYDIWLGLFSRTPRLLPPLRLDLTTG